MPIEFAGYRWWNTGQQEAGNVAWMCVKSGTTGPLYGAWLGTSVPQTLNNNVCGLYGDTGAVSMSTGGGM